MSDTLIKIETRYYMMYMRWWRVFHIDNWQSIWWSFLSQNFDQVFRNKCRFFFFRDVLVVLMCHKDIFIVIKVYAFIICVARVRKLANYFCNESFAIVWMYLYWCMVFFFFFTDVVYLRLCELLKFLARASLCLICIFLLNQLIEINRVVTLIKSVCEMRIFYSSLCVIYVHCESIALTN